MAPLSQVIPDFAQASNRISAAVRPVSYTHLDVYKRQGSGKGSPGQVVNGPGPSHQSKNGERRAGRSRRALHLQGRKGIDELRPPSFCQGIKVHPLMQIDSMPHDQMLVAGQNHVLVHRRQNVYREIVRPNHDGIARRQEFRGRKAKPGRAVIPTRRLGKKPRAMTRADQNDICLLYTSRCV